MKTMTDNSYGVVPVFQEDGLWKVLVVHQRSHRGDTFWIFPKGHAEEGEDDTSAAKRELLEETGISDVRLESERTFSMHYSFKHEGARIEKTVTYFIGYCEDRETKITQPHEIVDLMWLDLASAAERLTHQNSKDILSDVKVFLESR